MGMSEPGHGTDVLGMATSATPSEDGSHYTLNGTKMWITNGTVDGSETGDVFLVYAKTGSGRSSSDLSAFLVEKGMPGFTVGTKVSLVCCHMSFLFLMT
jgi:isovaleryl-CoA dehydrogenase